MGIIDKNESTQSTIQQVGKLNYYLYEEKENKALKLLEKGCDINQKAHDGELPLHLAAQFDLNKVAEKLIEMGADVNAESNSKLTPLHNANTPEMAELLIKNGAELNEKTVDGYTPLYYHARYFPYAKVLIKHGADINARTNSNNTPLHALCGSSMTSECIPESILFFLDNGADINAVNNDGETPFFALIKNENYCQKWQTEIPYIMLQKGANPFINNNKGENAVTLLEERIKKYEKENRTQNISYPTSKKLLEKIKNGI